MFIGRVEADYVALKCSTRLSNIDFSDWRNITSTATFYMEYAAVLEELVPEVATGAGSRVEVFL